jgi:tetratricopeptide (TPR) repeat protein
MREHVKVSFKRVIRVAGLITALIVTPGALQAHGLAGAYLAANQANIDNNYEAAARYYSQAIALDPGNPYLAQNALLAFVAKGDIDKSVAIARKVAASGAPSQLAQLVLLSKYIQSDQFEAAEALLEKDAGQFSPLMSALMKGWVQLGLGKMKEAERQFDNMKKPQAMRLFGQYHKALALAVVGDFAAADKILQGDEKGNLRLNRGSLIAHAQILSQLDRREDALKVLNDALRSSPDEELTSLRDAIESGKTVDYTFITDARAGAAEVFFTLASVLSREESDRFSLVYSRLASYLSPDHTEALLLSAGILRDQGQFDLANKAYAKVPNDSPLFLNAELGRVDSLQAAKKYDAAIEVLRGLTRSHAGVARVHMALGDALRGQERYGEATESYDKALALIPELTANYWFLFYSRGITYEREGKWDQAEADFRKALELAPDQPLVLNYLGYSMVEMGLNLEEAQTMIESAVKARPNDGYITDSLGWVLYRLGKYEEAVPQMERAVELVPNDPIINDHLGDVLWAVGRVLEADFQWKRALSFDPTEKDAVRIRRKLEIGLDAVLSEESDRSVSSNEN